MNKIISPLIVSLQITIVAGTIAIILGTVCGYFMQKQKFRGKSSVELLFMMPIVLPPSVIGFILLILIGKNGPFSQLIDIIFGGPIIFTKTAAIIASTIVAFPLMYQAAKSGFSSVESNIKEAARLDGANEVQVFSKISFPLASNILISGAILAVARAFGEFGATLMVAGNIPGKTQTLPTAIYMEMASNDRTSAWLYVSIMIFISIFFISIIRKYDKR